MGFAKYTEDNSEIMEERLYFNYHNTPEPLFTPTIKTASISQEKTIVNSTKKHKRKTKMIICCECNKSFKFTGGEQKYYEAHELNEPKRCPMCRKTRNLLFKSIKSRKENII